MDIGEKVGKGGLTPCGTVPRLYFQGMKFRRPLLWSLPCYVPCRKPLARPFSFIGGDSDGEYAWLFDTF